MKFFLFFHFYDVHAPYVFREDFREMYSDLDYYKELMAEVEEILGVENFTLGYFKSLTHEEKFKLLCYRLIDTIPEKIDKDVRRDVPDGISRIVLYIIRLVRVRAAGAAPSPDIYQHDRTKAAALWEVACSRADEQVRAGHRLGIHVDRCRIVRDAVHLLRTASIRIH